MEGKKAKLVEGPLRNNAFHVMSICITIQRSSSSSTHLVYRDVPIVKALDDMD